MATRNYGYDYFVPIIEYLYKTKFSYKIFHPSYEHKYKIFKELEPESEEYLPVIFFEKLKEWQNEGLNANRAIKTWENLKNLTNLILDNNDVSKKYNIGELKAYLNLTEELISLFENDIRDPLSRLESFAIKEELRPLSNNAIDFISCAVNVKVDDDLSKLTYKYNSKDLEAELEIKNPKLLIETLQKENEKFKLKSGGWVEPSKNIFDESKYSKLISKFFGRNTKIEFNGAKINWIASLASWPPSIDALFLASTLKEFHRNKGSLFSSDINNIGDIGCGTGFLGIFLSNLIPTIKKVYYSDSNYTSTVLALSNHKRNFLNSDFFGMSGFGLQPFYTIKNLTLDTILCNPPYIPSLGQRFPLSHAVLSGGLLFEIISNFQVISKSLISCLSLIAGDEIERAIDLSKKRYNTSLKYDIIKSLWVPFRIRAMNDESLKKLVDLGLILDLFAGPNEKTIGNDINKNNFKDNRTFRYWHQINIYIFQIE